MSLSRAVTDQRALHYDRGEEQTEHRTLPPEFYPEQRYKRRRQTDQLMGQEKGRTIENRLTRNVHTLHDHSLLLLLLTADAAPAKAAAATAVPSTACWVELNPSRESAALIPSITFDPPLPVPPPAPAPPIPELANTCTSGCCCCGCWYVWWGRPTTTDGCKHRKQSDGNELHPNGLTTPHVMQFRPVNLCS